MPDLAAHRLKIALLQPEIAPNTGNIARLCVATGTELHLARPLGFVLSDKNLRRSAMDYWPRLQLAVHDDTDSLLKAISPTSMWFLTSKSSRGIWDATFAPGDCLVFGPETRGISQDLLDRYPTRTLRIPQAPGERCLNLSTAAGIALYEALRQLNAAVRTR